MLYYKQNFSSIMGNKEKGEGWGKERVKVENVEFEIIKSEEDLCHGTFGSAGNNVELKDFYTILESHPTTSRLVALRDHSILLTCQQRILVPVLGHVLSKYIISEWRRSYDSGYQLDQLDVQSKKNGEDFFSLWQATLKLCMPENGDNDVVTEYFIKICRYFFAVIANHQLHIAGNVEAVSELLTSIERNIYKVELKFFENEMKYGKLVSIIEDVDKTYRSSIDVLKRFLKFVHLVLEKYVHDPDGNVSTIFQDAVKKFKAPRRFGKQQKLLLKHVPTDNQFKLLLNNPKNVKDCGTITTKLLDNLIHRLSSIL
ncbi:hypothetical protein FCV25MIE_02905, partial [Fagus crenata]